jgi:hypothetical protein
MTIKSRRMRWTGHAACIRGIIDTFRVLVGKPERNDHSKHLGVIERILLKRILKKQGQKLWIGFICLRTGTSKEL